MLNVRESLSRFERNESNSIITRVSRGLTLYSCSIVGCVSFVQHCKSTFGASPCLDCYNLDANEKGPDCSGPFDVRGKFIEPVGCDQSSSEWNLNHFGW